MAVLPTPGSPTQSGLFLRRRHSTWIDPLQLRLPADEGVDAPFGGPGHQVHGVGLEGVLGGGFGLLGGLGALRAGGPARLHRPAVGQVLEQGQPVDALALEQVGGLALLLLEQGHQDRAAVHLGPLGGDGVHDGPLHDPVEAQGGHGVNRMFLGQGLQVLAQPVLKLQAQAPGSPPQAGPACTTTGSSWRARSRCSRVRYSCRDVPGQVEGLLDAPVQGGGEGRRGGGHVRTPVPGCKQGEFLGFGHGLHLGRLGVGDVVGVDARQALAFAVHFQHDPHRLRLRLAEHALQDPHHEFLGGVVVVVQDDLPQDRRAQAQVRARLAGGPARIF